jgi:Tol biopolymer transport system component
MSFAHVAYSADGSRIFYNRGASADGCCQLWVVTADGSDPHELIPAPGEAWDGVPVVSPDGAWIAYSHNPNDGPARGVSVVRADGTGTVIETGPALSGSGANWVWAPDSSKILMYPNDDSSPYAYLLDPEGGPWTTVPWRSDADLDWQRTATE